MAGPNKAKIDMLPYALKLASILPCTSDRDPKGQDPARHSSCRGGLVRRLRRIERGPALAGGARTDIKNRDEKQ